MYTLPSEHSSGVERMIRRTRLHDKHAFAFRSVLNAARTTTTDWVATSSAVLVQGGSAQPETGCVGIACEYFKVGGRLVGRVLLSTMSPLSVPKVVPGLTRMLLDVLFEASTPPPELTRREPLTDESIDYVMPFTQMQVSPL